MADDDELAPKMARAHKQHVCGLVKRFIPAWLRRDPYLLRHHGLTRHASVPLACFSMTSTFECLLALEESL